MGNPRENPQAMYTYTCTVGKWACRLPKPAPLPYTVRMENSYAVAMTTVPDEQQAGELARSIVAAGLAACVQILPIRSVYRWKGEVCNEPECLLVIKTTAARFPELEQHIRAHHAYETPEIIQLPITAGSHDYLAWIDASVATPKLDPKS